MRVSVIGTGYVGLVSGVCLAERGHEVCCVDLDRAKIDQINRGQTPIHEHGLADLLIRNVGKRFRATANLREAVLNSELSLIAVGTPFDGEQIDLRYIQEAARQIGAALRDKNEYHVVVVKSTVVPGTTEEVVLPILEQSSGKRAGTDFGLGMNPEFLREGAAVQDFLEPDRIVLGALDDRSKRVLQELYAPFANVDRLHTNPRTAETIKYAANALLATLISFSNEIGNLCAAVGGVDVVEVMRGVHLDKRFSPILPTGERVTPGFLTYLAAGCGFGGSCFPKDLKALITFGERAGSNMQLLRAVVGVNRTQPQQVMRLLSKHFPELAGLRVSVLGLAFKPGTDDVRESPAIPILQELMARKALVKAYDPIVKPAQLNLQDADQIVGATSLKEAINGAEAVLLLTRWAEFAAVPGLVAGEPKPPLVIDGRRMLNPSDIARYEGIGLAAAGQRPW